MRDLTVHEKIKMIQRLDEKKAALKDYSQYADTIKQIERLINMLEVSIKEVA